VPNVPKRPKVPNVPQVLASLAMLCAVGTTGTSGTQSTSGTPGTLTVTVSQTAVLTMTIHARCDRCDWAVSGREAVALTVSLDGRYSQHLPLVRTGEADYQILVGTVEAGTHQVAVAVDVERSARDLRASDAASFGIKSIERVMKGDPRFDALSRAPFVYERANTAGRFSDVPVFAWYEREPAPGGVRYRYSVIFTNEDGGTPADRLMATWGRTTDVEYVYSAEVDASGRIVAEDYQGPDHEVLAFKGRREAGHPLLWVTTDNNMVQDRGDTTVRFAPAPIEFHLANVSREVVMDDHPWLYALAEKELAREGKIDPEAPPGVGRIPDTRRFVHVEGCGTVGDAALTFGVRTGDGSWTWADRGRGYGIARDGCFRGAVPLPAKTMLADVRAVGVRAIERSGRAGQAPARMTSVNKVFMLDERFVPGRSIAAWQGSMDLRPGGPPLEIPVK
jgi:hypothetical protein